MAEQKVEADPQVNTNEQEKPASIDSPAAVKVDVMDLFSFESSKEPDKKKAEGSDDKGKEQKASEGTGTVVPEKGAHEEEGENGGTPTKKEGEAPATTPEMSALMALVQSQAEQLKALTSKIEGLTSKPEEKKEPEKPKFSIDLSDEDFDKAFEDKGKFMSILEQVYNKAVEDVKASIPKKEEAKPDEQMVATKVEKFYESNQDLKPHRAFVQFISSAVVTEKPNLDIDAILTEVESRVRTQLNLTKKEEQKQEKKPEEEDHKRSPQFARSRGGKVQQQEVPSLKKELLDLM